MAVTLFISYSKADRDYVEWLAARLEQEAGIKAWWYEQHQKPARTYQSKIRQSIASAHAVLVMVSKASANSPNVLDEITYTERFKEREIPIIALIIGSPTNGSPFEGIPDGDVPYKTQNRPCINTRDGSDPIPKIIDYLTPDRHSELSFDALDLDPNAPPNHLAGKSIKGYLIDQRVSVTSQSVVFSAVEPSVGRKVAIKVIRPELANQPDYIRRFAEEARRVARLDHPHILKLYTFWRNPSGAYLVMPWMTGGTLEQVRREGPVALPRVARMFAQLAAAVGYAHRHGVIHRDLKPANVLRDSNDNVYLADFSIAQGASQGASGFTPGYAPPEQYQDDALATPQLDIYSLAILLFELLTGKLAFDGADPKTIYQLQLAGPPALNDLRPDLPATLDAAIRRALDPDPAARFSDIASFASAIREGLVAALADSTREPTEILPLLDLVTTTNPYKGLEAFEEDDVLVFFGRDQLTRSLLAQLGAPGVGGRFLAVVGPSGSGKSSVVKAGLLPALRSGALPGSQSWFFATITPGDHMVRNLVAALEQLTLTPLGDEAVRRIIADEGGLLAVVHEALPPDSVAELLLVVDQLEELFTLSQDPALTPLLLRRLAAAVQASQSRLRVVVTLRGDFYDQALAIASFGDLLDAHHERVRVLNEQELVQAIVAPAGRMGARVDSDLLGAIVADMEDQPGALPLLQFALHRLFEQREGDRLTFAAYGQQGGVQGAMANAADRLYASLSPSQQQLARQIFLRLLILGEDGIATRRRVRQSELRELVRPAEPESSATISTTIPANAQDMPTEDAAAFSTPTEDGTGAPASHTSPPVPQILATTSDLDMILNRYGNARLLTLDFEPATREPTVEVAHEALITGWRRLRDEWLKDTQADLRTRQRLSEAAAEWQRRDYDAAYLERGGYLGRFADLSGGGSIDLTVSERRFVEASVAERDRVERDEKERLERSNRQLRRLTLFLSLFLIVALIASTVAGVFGVQAQDRLRVAESQRLAAEASALLSRGETERGLLLAMEAVQIDANPGTREVLQALVNSRPYYEITTLQSHSTASKRALFSPDGRNIVVTSGGTARWLDANGKTITTLVDGLEESADSIAISPDGTRIVVTFGTLALLLDTTGRILAFMIGHTDTIWDANFSPDGQYIVTASWDGTARVWDAQGKIVTVLEGHTVTGLEPFTDNISTAKFSPDGKQIVTASYDETARLWDPQGRTITTFTGHTSAVTDAAFSPDGSMILTASLDDTARLWSLEGEQMAILRGHSSAVVSAVFSPDGRFILTASWDNTARLWDLTKREVLVLKGHSAKLNSAVFNQDGSLILTASKDETVRLWNLQGQTVAILEGQRGDFLNATFSSSEGQILAVSGDVRLWSYAGSPFAILQGHTDKVNSAVFSPDGSRILTASDDGTVRLWSEAGQQEAEITAHEWNVVNAIFSPDGTRFLTASGDETAKVWSKDGQLIATLSEHDNSLTGAIFSPSGNYILTASDDNTARLWSSEGKLLSTMEVRTEEFNAVNTTVFSPDETRILTASEDGKARIWDAKGNQLAILEGHTEDPINDVEGASFSPDGRFIVTASFDQTARLWDSNGELIAILSGHNAYVTSAVFSQDSKYIASTSWVNEDLGGGSVRIWDISGKAIAIMSGHTGNVTGVVFSPDGQYLLTASEDGTARLWDISGRLIVTLRGHTAAVTSAVFNSDGTRIITASADGTARVWPVAIEDWLGAAACRVGRSLTDEEIQTYSVPTPLKFKYEDRQCPPVYSWERASK